MRTLMSRMLMIAMLAFAASLGLATTVNAKSDIVTPLHHTEPQSPGHRMTESRLKQMIVQEAVKTKNVTPSVALAVVSIFFAVRGDDSGLVTHVAAWLALAIQ